MASDASHRRFAAWIIESGFPIAELPPATGVPDWRLVRDAAACERSGTAWYQRADAADGLPWVWFGRGAGGDVVRFPGLGWCRFDGDREIACIWRKHLQDAEAEHLLLNHVLPIAASRAAFLVLHASVVVRPGGGAVAFAGNVGAGKSTAALAMAANGWRLLSDDRLVIDGRGMAYPIAPYLRVSHEAAARFHHQAAPPAGHSKVRLRADGRSLAFQAEPVRLERIVVIDGDGAAAMPRREATTAVLASLLQLGLDQRLIQRRVFERVAELVASVPIGRLPMTKRWERLSEIERTLRNA